MSKRKVNNDNRNSKILSTKELEGKRVGGVLYLKKGVGTGCFSHVNPTASGNDQNTVGSSQIIPNVKNR